MRGLMCNSLNILPLYLPIFLKNNVMTHKTFFFPLRENFVYCKQKRGGNVLEDEKFRTS